MKKYCGNAQFNNSYNETKFLFEKYKKMTFNKKECAEILNIYHIDN